MAERSVPLTLSRLVLSAQLNSGKKRILLPGDRKAIRKRGRNHGYGRRETWGPRWGQEKQSCDPESVDRMCMSLGGRGGEENARSSRRPRSALCFGWWFLLKAEAWRRIMIENRVPAAVAASTPIGTAVAPCKTAEDQKKKRQSRYRLFGSRTENESNDKKPPEGKRGQHFCSHQTTRVISKKYLEECLVHPSACARRNVTGAG